MNRATKIAIVIAVILLLSGGTGLAYRAGWLWETAEQKKVNELKAQIQQQFKDQKSAIPRPEFFKSMQEMRKQAESLPQQYQQQLREAAGNMMRRKFESDVDAYIKLPPAERKKELDKRIVEMEKMRKQFEAARNQSGGGNQVAGGPRTGGGPPTGGPGGGPGPGGPGSGPPATGGPGTPAAGGPPSGGPTPGGPMGGGRGMAGMLDSTSPEFRAKMGIFIRDMTQRRKELGLPEFGRFGGGPR